MWKNRKIIKKNVENFKIQPKNEKCLWKNENAHTCMPFSVTISRSFEKMSFTHTKMPIQMKNHNFYKKMSTICTKFKIFKKTFFFHFSLMRIFFFIRTIYSKDLSKTDSFFDPFGVWHTIADTLMWKCVCPTMCAPTNDLRRCEFLKNMGNVECAFASCGSVAPLILCTRTHVSARFCVLEKI